MCDAYPAVPRYFKQIVKSARANGTARPTEDHTDDFLGCLNIPVWVSGCKGFTHGCFTSLEYVAMSSPKHFPSFLSWCGGIMLVGKWEGQPSGPSGVQAHLSAHSMLVAHVQWEVEVFVLSLASQYLCEREGVAREIASLNSLRRRCQWLAKIAGSSWNHAPAPRACRETASWPSS